MNTLTLRSEKTGILISTASLFTALTAGLACIGPMLGIAFGVAGLGWLSQFSYLTVPASVASLALLVCALYLFKTRNSSCASRWRHRLSIVFITGVTLVVTSINIFEYLILPNLI